MRWEHLSDRHGVSVYDKTGKRIATIVVPERPSNLCFGGKGNMTLFITARTSLYCIQCRSKDKKQKPKPTDNKMI
jgi:gluconolactonase